MDNEESEAVEDDDQQEVLPAGKKRRCGWFPVRLMVAFMMFWGCWCNSMMRADLNTAIVAMAKPVELYKPYPECHSDDNNTITAYDIIGHRFDWNPILVGHLLSAHFWGLVLGSIPGGLLADVFGARIVVFWSTILGGLLACTSPIAAGTHWSLLYAWRFLGGILSGTIFPSMHSNLAHWSPRFETGRFLFALFGANVATIIMTPIYAEIIKVSKNWKGVFFLSGIVPIVFSVFWWILIRDSPAKHPLISEKEKRYISEAIAAKGGGKKVHKFPLKKVMLSVPFWALVIAHIGDMWGLLFIVIMGPTFMREALGLDLERGAVFAVMPLLVRVVVGCICSIIVDSLITGNYMRTVTIRKLFVISSHIIPGILQSLTILTGCNRVLTIALITMSLGFNGAATVTNLANHHDLAPNFAGMLYGIMSFLGMSIGAVIPIAVGYITVHHNGMHQWRIILVLIACAYFFPGIIFLIFGSSETQSWNEPKDDETATLEPVDEEANEEEEAK